MVFHIVAEYPQVKHVSSQMNPAVVHEHRSEDGQETGAGIGKEAAGDKSPFHNESVTATQLYQEKQNVQSDQGIRDQWNSSARGIIITDWQHKTHLLLLIGYVTASRQDESSICLLYTSPSPR